MKKIAIFQTDLNIGGIQKSLVNLLNNIDCDKYEVDVYLFEKENVFIDDLPINVNIKYLDKGSKFNKFIYFNLLNMRYTSQVNKEYDVAIDFNSYSMDTALACINCNAKKKVCYIHNDIKIKLKEEPKYRILHHFFKNKYKYYDALVGVSGACVDTFEEVHGGLGKKYYVIPNLINTDEIFTKAKVECPIKVSSDVYNLCSVGRIVHQKGFDILLMYIAELIKYRTDFHLYIVGDGPDRDNIEKQLLDLKLSNFVTLCGYQKNPFSIMNEMDGFVLTSRYEGQGMVFLEAKALGLDIVMPSRLEKYVDDINGTDDIVNALNTLKKGKKKRDDLSEYNKKSLDVFYDMIDSNQ